MTTIMEPDGILIDLVEDSCRWWGDKVCNAPITLVFFICGCVRTTRALDGSVSTNLRKVTAVMRWRGIWNVSV